MTKIEDLTEKNKELRRQVKGLEEENQTLRSAKYRLENWIKRKFEWWAKLIANDSSPCMKYLINDTAKILKLWD